MSAAEEAFAAAWTAQTIMPAAPEREYRFHPVRRWRFDFAWPAIKLAVEIQGGGMGGRMGGHQTAKGMQNDCDKNNAAILLGWRVLTFRAGDKRNALDWARTVLEVMCG